MKKIPTIACLLPVAAAWQAAAQSWDTSGNGLLSGAYYFRQVVWVAGDNAGDLKEAVSAYGQISFDGNGHYTISNQSINDSANNNTPTNNLNVSGTYAIAPSGYGSISSPVSNGDTIYGLVSHGIFIGSSTDNGSGYNDMFVAAQLGSPAPTNATFNGTYNMVDIDFTAIGQGGVVYNRQSTFQLRPNGGGSITSVSLNGYIAGSGTKVINQSISSVPYFASGGAFNFNFGSKALNATDTSHLIAGTKYLYISPDGNFVFGGDPQYAWDMILGVKQGSGTPNFSGLYDQAGVVVDNSQLANGGIFLYTQYGSLNDSSGVLLAHQRYLDAINNMQAVDYTYSDAATANGDGTYSDSFNKYFFGGGGAIGVGIGTSPFFGVTALVQAPSFTAPNTPFIFPTGIVNAGSSVPFTASLAPGELVSIYGTNLTSTTATDGTLPTSLAGVQVLVNNTAAPIYSVAHTSSYDQINAVIPLGTTSTIAAIRVTNSSGSSNTVTSYVNLTQPGAFNSFTATPAVQHGADYSLVTPSNPARVGETLLVYLTGLGTLNSSGNANNSIGADFDGITATVAFAGTQSSVGGGYQMNVVVPSGITNNPTYLGIGGPDAYNQEVAIPIAIGTAEAIRSSARVARPRRGEARNRPMAKSRRQD
jgi:uncharacterized protein (TIGR03437 family)